MKKNYIFLLVVSLISATLVSQTPYDSFAPESTRPMLDNSLSLAEVTAIERTFKQNNAVDFQWDSFALRADSGSLVHNLPFSFALIPNGGEHRMPSYMVNVTGENVGAYRLLPNGVHFSEPATIAVPYDDFLLPMGYNPKDIKTYYFDEDLAQWKELERVSVDTAKHVVISYTTHFTEFANAVIKLPEVPEMKAFVPTAMQDLPDVNPLQGIPMIAPPTANNRGTAELTYPIELPAGRNGMQPNIDLHYSSAGGNDILGVGWSFAQPAITIDTRWGVPRYDERWETEAYLLNGEQIVLHDENDEPIPLPHQAGDRGFERRKFGVVQYYARDTKNQDRIVRHGNSLDSIWWDVVDRNGTKSYYGFDPIDSMINYNAVVMTEDSAIAYWALTATMDIYGNYVRYRYIKDTSEVYLDRIEYTGFLSPLSHIAPSYSVHFRYFLSRPDTIINGRIGVLQKKGYLLQCITLKYKESYLSQYRMHYNCGDSTLYKTRLKEITKYDEPWCTDCIFTYPQHNPVNEWDAIDNYLLAHDAHDYDAISGALDDGLRERIPGSRTTFKYQNAKPITALFGQEPNASVQQLFNQSINRSWSIGGTATVGCDYIPVITSLSVGGNYSYSQGTGTIETMMLDMDADGLPDLVYQDSESVKYCKQKTNGTFNSPITIPGINALSREVSDNHSFGVQLDLFANFSYNPTISNSYTDIYFSDVNGDGLPDQVTPEGIKINHLDNNEHPSFLPLGSSTTIAVNNSRCGTIHRTNEVDPRLECHSEWVRVAAILRSDSLKPYGFNTSDNYPDDEYTYVERPQFPLSNNIAGTHMRETAFYEMANITPVTSASYSDDSPSGIHLPQSPTGYGRTYTLNLPEEWLSDDYKVIKRGDSLIVYHLETICPETSTLPDVDIVRVWVAPYGGTIRLTSDIHLKRDSSDSRLMSRKADGVKYSIQYNQPQRNFEYYVDILDSGRIAADRTDTIHSVYNSLYVEPNEIFFFRLSANGNRRFDNVEWVQNIQYLSNWANQPNETFNSATDYVCFGQNDFVAPCNGKAIFGYVMQNDQNEWVDVYVKKNSTELPLQSSYYDPSLVRGDTISFHTDYPNDEPIWSDVHIHPYVKFVSLATDSAYASISDTLYYYPDVHINCSSSFSSESNTLRQLFGPLHKGWGQFAYNNRNKDVMIDILSLENKETDLTQSIRNDTVSLNKRLGKINTSNLRDSLQMGLVCPTAQFVIDTIQNYNPLGYSNKWIAMHADSRTETWKAYGNLGAIGKKLHSTSIQLDTTLVHTDSLATDVTYDSSIPVASISRAPVTTVRKKNSSVQHGFSVSAIVANLNTSMGTNDVEMDYADMNGDGFPDFVSPTSIQYSTPWGGFDSSVTPVKVQMGHNEMFSYGGGFSGSSNNLERILSNRARSVNMFNSSLGIGGNQSYSDNQGLMTCMDINADGLPDLVKISKNNDYDSVWYNLGYSFSSGEKICGLIINDGKSSSFSLNASLGFSLSQYSISGGVCESRSCNSTSQRMVDINGDGYPDRVYSNSNLWCVQPFVNGTFSNGQSLGVASTISSFTDNKGTNLGVTAGFTFGVIPVKLCFGIQSTPSSKSTTYGMSDFMDVNGDGFVDYIVVDNSETKVYYNQNGLIPVNMLTEVSNPTGQIIELTYGQTTPSVAQRGRSWYLEAVKDSIMASDYSEIRNFQFSYEKPYHDNFEKTDYGYATVMTNNCNKKRLEEYYSTDDFMTKGEKTGDLLTDDSGNRYIGHQREMHFMDAAGDETKPDCNDAAIYIQKEGYETLFFEGESSPVITTMYELEYDRFHNIVVRRDYGDVAVANDDWVQTITYDQPSQNIWRHNLISLPIFDSITDAGGQDLRVSRAKYNHLGRLSQVMYINKSSSQDIVAETYLGYDTLGNLAEVRFPEDKLSAGQRAWLKIKYDTATYTHPSLLMNQFLEQQYTLYNHRFGLPTMVIDPSGNAIQYRYDTIGRLIDVIAPADYLHSDEPYTVHYSYRIRGYELNQNIPPHSLHPYVIKVALSNGTAQAESTIYDQRGHEKQCKRFSTVYNNLGWVVDGVTAYDAYYNPISKSLPFIASELVGDWDYTPPSGETATMQYDVLDRMTYFNNFDYSEKYWQYGFAVDGHNHQRLLTEVTDENNYTSSVLKSPQDWTIQTLTPDGYSTCYEYNPLGERTKVTDADGYETTYMYDTWGNMTERNHPDAGITTWTYAPAGNVLTMQTSELQQNSQFIEYQYDYGRLKEISYPEHPENNVTYYYDNAGRIGFREDGVGSEELMYDELGNVKRSYRRVLVPTENYVYFFETRHKYDSFGKIQHIIYPDQDSVAYNYLPTGELSAVVHKSAGTGSSLQTIVSNIEYDEYGHKVHQSYGNQVETDYSYSPLRQWMTQLETRLPSSGPNIQDLYYAYDDVGNITMIEQYASDYYGLGGDYYNEYTYDDQYRLVSALGSSSNNLGYNFTMSYSPSGRIWHNSCGSSFVNKQVAYGYDDQFLTHQPRVVFDTIASDSYNLYWDSNGNLHEISNCKSEKVRFHDWDEENRLRAVIGPNHIGLYGYDGDGNRVWKLISDCSQESQNGDELTYGAYIDDAVLYPNPYVTITPQGYTKHYYLGEERIAAAIGQGGWEQQFDDRNNHELEIHHYYWAGMSDKYPLGEAVDPKVDNVNAADNYPSELQYSCPPFQLERLLIGSEDKILYNCLATYSNPSGRPEDMYYTHSDHLGSASWITDGVGNPVQYIHYAPYGELLASQKATGSSYDERYKFTGKERDVESGYDYYGARYQIVPLGIWGSPDPLLDKYIFASPYMYCNGNPIKFVDPDGRGVFPCAAALRQAGEEVVNNPRYLRNGKTTYCNMGAQAINAQAGDQSLRGRANEMGSTLRNPEIATEVSQSEALEYANMGAVVFASYVSDGSEPGHIAVVAPTEDLTYSPSRKESVVSVFNVGAQNGEMPLSKAFGKRSVGMYILNNDLNTINEKMSTIDGGSLQEIVVSGNGTAKVNAQIKAIEVKSPNVSIDLW